MVEIKLMNIMAEIDKLICVRRAYERVRWMVAIEAAATTTNNINNVGYCQRNTNFIFS